MAKRPTPRRTSGKPGATPALVWIGGGGLGVAAMILGISVLTHEPSDQTVQAASAETQSSSKSPTPTAPQTPVRTQKIRQLPAAPKPVQPPPTAPPTSPSRPPVSMAPPPAGSPTSVLAVYFYDVEAHRADLNDYVQGLMDSPVEWVGYLASVVRREIGPTVLLRPVQSDNPFDIAYIDFPVKFNEDVDALAKLDKVRIKGFYRGGGPMPHVEGTSIELVDDGAGP